MDNKVNKKEVKIMQNVRMKVKIEINSHGNWNNLLELDGEYNQVKEQIDLFYKIAQACMDKAIERVKTHHEGVASHTK